MEEYDDRIYISKEEDDEEEWDEDEEVIEEDEEIVEEDEEDEEERQKKPAAKEDAKVKEEKPAEKPQKPEEKPREEKKPEPPKAEKAEPRKPAEPKPEKKPKTPEEMLKMGRMVFLAGLIVFFLATCAERSHLHSMMGKSHACFKLSHEADEPVKPAGPFRQSSTKIDPKERDDENGKFREEFQKADEEFQKGAAMQEYLKAVEEWKKEKHEDSEALQKAKIALDKAKMGAGAWACTRYYAGMLGLLVMIAGMGLVFLHGSPFEKAAVLVLIWVGVISVMNGGLLTGGSAIERLLGMMR